MWDADSLQERGRFETGEPLSGFALGERHAYAAGRKLVVIDLQTDAVREGDHQGIAIDAVASSLYEWQYLTNELMLAKREGLDETDARLEARKGVEQLVPSQDQAITKRPGLADIELSAVGAYVVSRQCYARDVRWNLQRIQAAVLDNDRHVEVGAEFTCELQGLELATRTGITAAVIH